MTTPDASSRGPDSAPSGAVSTGLFLTSASLLTLEVLQTRLFSYSLSSLLFYAAVAVALLGMGASGTALTLWSGWRAMRLGSVTAVASAGFAVTTVASHVLFARVSQDLEIGFNATAIFVFLALAVPYFFAGATITACLAAAPSGIHKAYFVNLLGSALGCYLMFLGLEPLGAPVMLVAVALMTVVASASFWRAGAGRAARVTTAAAAAIAAAPLVAPDAVFPFRPDPSGQLNIVLKTIEQLPEAPVRAETVWRAWDPTGHVELTRFPGVDAALPEPLPYLFYSQDGSAGSFVLGVEDDVSRAAGLFERTLYGAPYQLRGRGNTDSVLIIGLGGAPDVIGALYFGVGSITGVEINASAIEALRGPVAGFAGDPYGRDHVSVHHMDGRTFVRSTDQRFDLIVMSGTDTKSTLAAGSLAISENHLYSVEAFGEYLDHLAAGGHLAFLRFGVNERLRLAELGLAALRVRGVAQPRRHLVALRQGLMWTTVLIGRDPIEPADRERIASWAESVPKPLCGVVLPVYEVINHGLSPSPEMLYPLGDPARDVLPDALIRPDERPHMKPGIVDLPPPTDDRPFFFDYQRRDEILSAPAFHYRLLGSLLGIMTLLAALLIALPVPIARGLGGSGGRPLRSAIYFTCLGVGFMLLEIGLVQKLVLLLGHQSYAITVVLATILVGAGFGSVLAGRYAGDPARLVRRVAVPAILVWGAVLMFALDRGGHLAAPLPLFARIGITALGLFPLGLALGVPFPTGLATLDRTAPSLVPWAIGANGFASVIGASAALPGAMLFGYRTLILIAFAIYVVAALAYPTTRRGT